MALTVRVGQRGVITIPAQLRERYRIREGDTLQLADMDGVFVLIPFVPLVPELAREIEQMRIEAGFTIEELLESLRKQRVGD